MKGGSPWGKGELASVPSTLALASPLSSSPIWLPDGVEGSDCFSHSTWRWIAQSHGSGSHSGVLSGSMKTFPFPRCPEACRLWKDTAWLQHNQSRPRCARTPAALKYLDGTTFPGNSLPSYRLSPSSQAQKPKRKLQVWQGDSTQSIEQVHLYISLYHPIDFF